MAAWESKLTMRPLLFYSQLLSLILHISCSEAIDAVDDLIIRLLHLVVYAEGDVYAYHPSYDASEETTLDEAVFETVVSGIREHHP